MWQLRFKGPEWLFLPVGLLLNEWGSCKTQYSLLKLVIAFERLLCFFCSSVVFELSCAQLERHDVTLSCAPIRFLVTFELTAVGLFSYVAWSLSIKPDQPTFTQS